MSRKRKILFITAVILQAVVLLSMIANQELLLKNGTKVMLKCVPVDPRSLFSGDYVQLNYEISEIRKGATESEQKKFDSFSEDDTIFVALVKNRDDHFYSIGDYAKTADELNKNYRIILKGTVDDAYYVIRIRYGIETYFVPQSEGKEIETNMTEVSAEVSIAEDGRSALSRLFIAGEEVKFY
jgi:uncharacterized membrane-anchored protein